VATSGRTQARQSITEGFHQPIIRVEVMTNTTSGALPMPVVDVFPNPVSDALQVQFNEPVTKAWQLILTHADGTVISTAIQNTGNTDASLDVSSLPAGMYFLVIRSEDNLQQQQYRISKIQ
jgi:hypothetical protein